MIGNMRQQRQWIVSLFLLILPRMAHLLQSPIYHAHTMQNMTIFDHGEDGLEITSIFSCQNGGKETLEVIIHGWFAGLVVTF